MVLNDSLANALSKIDNAVRSLSTVVVLSKSKLLLGVLDLLKENGYVGSYSVIEDGRGGLVEVNLLGTINSCSVIKPRSSVKLDDFEACEKRFLPAKDFGVLIISTNKGLLTQQQAREQNVGGNLIAYCY